ncbi:atp-dependent rna helicase dhx29 [Nannochloropsis oceanica]
MPLKQGRKAANAATTSGKTMKVGLGKKGETTILSVVQQQVGKKSGTVAASSTDLGSKRLAKKLEGLYERLVEIGFREAQIEQALTVCTLNSNGDIALESVLDWLCLNVRPEELPAQFADPSVQEARTQPGTLGVGHAGATLSSEERASLVATREVDLDLGAHLAAVTRDEDGDEEEEEEGRNGDSKRWILEYARREAEAELAAKKAAQAQLTTAQRWESMTPEQKLELLEASYEEEKRKAKEARDSGREGRREKAETEVRLKDIREQIYELKVVVGQRKREMAKLKNQLLAEMGGSEKLVGGVGGGGSWAALMGGKGNQKVKEVEVEECDFGGMFEDDDDDSVVEEKTLNTVPAALAKKEKEKELKVEQSIIDGLFGGDNESSDENDRPVQPRRPRTPPKVLAAPMPAAPPSPDRAVPGAVIEVLTTVETTTKATALPSRPLPSQSQSPPPEESFQSTSTSLPGVPKNWTGKTPRRHLEEYLQKKRLGKANFQKAAPGGKGCVLTLRGIPERFESIGEFNTHGDSQHAAATRALYRLEPKLQLSRVLPPPFREWWAEWQEAERKQREVKLAAVKRGKKDRIASLVQSMQEGVSLGGGQDGKEHGSKEKGGGQSGNGSEGIGVMLTDNSEVSWEMQDVSLDEAQVEKGKEERMSTGAATAASSATPSSNVLNGSAHLQRLAAEKEDVELGKKLRQKFKEKQRRTKYQELARVRWELPVAATREEILRCVEREPVVVISGETGCGKSTQVAQYILEEALLRGEGHKLNLVCTQPRRVAAVSLAERVAQEMGDEGGAGGSGALVGYQIRMESKTSAATRLTFCTTGILLRKLQMDPTLQQYTHIILDEVHERQALGDFLLVVLRDLVRVRSDLRLILMSATVNADLFCRYFGGCPTFTIPGRYFPVEERYLEDALEATGCLIEEGSAYVRRKDRAQFKQATVEVSGRGGRSFSQKLEWQEEEAETEGRRGSQWVNFLEECRDAGYSSRTLKSLGRVDEAIVNFDLLEDLLRHIVEVEAEHVAAGEPGWRVDGAILVFLPGLGEIRGILERLRGGRFFRDEHQYWLLPLHSALSSAEQQKVFQHPPHGSRKIIFSTNIAETSVTVDDVVYVIDCGLVREIQLAKGRGGGRALVTTWACRASAKQRMGRAGRVGPGVCFRLFSRHTYRKIMAEFAVPELQRTPLEELCLQIRANNLAPSCREFLLKAPEPPESSAIDTAIRVLQEVGALSRMNPQQQQQQQQQLQQQREGAQSLGREEEEGMLTPLGIHLAKLPLDVRLGKMLVFAALLQCLDPVLTIAAGLSGTKSPFIAPMGKEAEARAIHAKFEVRQSDFLTMIQAFEAYRAACLKGGAGEEHKFCVQHFLGKLTLREIADLKSQYLGLLVDMGLVAKPPHFGTRGGGVASYRALEEFMASPTALRKGVGVNAEAQNTNLVLAVVAAGLYPHVAHAVLEPFKKRPSFYHGPAAAPSSPVFLHPSSVNHGLPRFSSPWLVFHEKFHTTRAYIAPTSVVSPYALLLFGGPLVVNHLANRVVIDEWIEFTCPARTAVLFREMRKRLNEVLEVLVAKSLVGLTGKDSEQEAAVVDAIVSLLRGEEIKAAWVPGGPDDPDHKQQLQQQEQQQQQQQQQKPRKN